MQVDVLIDETYAVVPTGYYLTDFLASYNLTMADVANYSWGGSIPKVLVPNSRTIRESADPLTPWQPHYFG